MKEYKFTVMGNQENPRGNPIPYHRQTQKSSRFDPAALRYQAWKQHVVSAFVKDTGWTVNKWVRPSMLRGRKFVYGSALSSSKDNKYRMSIMIYFADYSHADPDNIFKGIADALFDSDKYLAGEFDFGYDEVSPRVEIKIVNSSLDT